MARRRTKVKSRFPSEEGGIQTPDGFESGCLFDNEYYHAIRNSEKALYIVTAICGADDRGRMAGWNYNVPKTPITCPKCIDMLKQ